MNKPKIVHSVSKAKYLGIYLTGLILGTILLIVSFLTLIGLHAAFENSQVGYYFSPPPFFLPALGVISISLILAQLFFIASNIVLLIL